MLKNQLKEKWFRCITMHVVGSVINYLITIVIFRTGHTFIAASMLTFCGFLHLPRTVFLEEFRLNFLQSEKKFQISF